MSENITLIMPDKKYLVSYIEAFDEYAAHHVNSYKFSDAHEYDIFLKFENDRLGCDLPENRVPATSFWLVNEREFIGEIAIRHTLNDNLRLYGGHIGYGIKYSEWNKGYGTKMLYLALEKAVLLGLDSVLITCDDDNFGSARIIEKCGGMLEDKIMNTVDEKTICTRRYWIDTSGTK